MGVAEITLLANIPVRLSELSLAAQIRNANNPRLIIVIRTAVVRLLKPLITCQTPARAVSIPTIRMAGQVGITRLGAVISTPALRLVSTKVEVIPRVPRRRKKIAIASAKRNIPE
jgi:hypothetical protein